MRLGPRHARGCARSTCSEVRRSQAVGRPLRQAAWSVGHRGLHLSRVRARTAAGSGSDRTLPADRVVTLPSFGGPSLLGLPHDGRGLPGRPTFMARFAGTKGVYAAGDITDFAIKHGGLAAPAGRRGRRGHRGRRRRGRRPPPVPARPARAPASGAARRYLTADLIRGQDGASEGRGDAALVAADKGRRTPPGQLPRQRERRRPAGRPRRSGSDPGRGGRLRRRRPPSLMTSGSRARGSKRR